MVFIIGTLMIAIIVFVIIGKKRKNTGDPSAKRIDLDSSSSSSVHFSDDFRSGELITTDHNHTIATILISKKDTFIWVCPSCETENPSSKQKCRLCHYKM